MARALWIAGIVVFGLTVVGAVSFRVYIDQSGKQRWNWHAPPKPLLDAPHPELWIGAFAFPPGRSLTLPSAPVTSYRASGSLHPIYHLFRLLNASSESGHPLPSFYNAIKNGIINGMPITISIDKAGRIVLPKAIRQRLHIDESCRLEVEIVGEKIEITPAPAEVTIENRDGLPVIVGWDGFDAGQAVAESRQDHLARLEGDKKA